MRERRRQPYEARAAAEEYLGNSDSILPPIVFVRSDFYLPARRFKRFLTGDAHAGPARPPSDENRTRAGKILADGGQRGVILKRSTLAGLLVLLAPTAGCATFPF